MGDKKNIDRLFQEKFKDFEAVPSDVVWKKIQAKKNKDRKQVLTIPFWYRIGSVAALVAILLSLGTFFFTGNNIEDTIVTTDDSENIKLIPKNDNPLVEKTKNVENNTDINHSENAIKTNEAITDNLNKLDAKNSSVKGTKDGTILKETTPPSQNKTGIAISNGNEKEKSYSLKNNDNPKEITNYKQTTTAIVKDPSKELENNTIDHVREDITNENKTLTKEEAIAATINKDEKEFSEKETNELPTQHKKSIFDVIEEKKQKEQVIVEASSEKRWNITPNVAPVYYDSFDGSSINSEFSDNNKQGLVNLSYGIQVAYNINKKLIVRSGVNKVNVGYNTEDIGFGVASISRTANSNATNNTPNIVVSDFRSGRNTIPLASPGNENILVTSQNPGLLNHSIGYLEVPVEVKYAIMDATTIGIHMIGGVSTLFLDNEEVVLVAGSFRNDNVIRDQTVNDISFSGNIGIGFDYKLSDQFLINMEPIFKYQVNGFRNSAENFKPYSFGIYTGINFNF